MIRSLATSLSFLFLLVCVILFIAALVTDQRNTLTTQLTTIFVLVVLAASSIAFTEYSGPGDSFGAQVYRTS
jgi:hypothetical protein